MPVPAFFSPMSAETFLDALVKISSALSPELPFSQALRDLLSVLAESMPFQRPHIVVQDPESLDLRLSLSHGEAGAPEASYAPGTGVTGRVFASGQPIIVPCMMDEPDFENRLFGRDQSEMAELAFISVPVKAHNVDGEDETIGVLSVDTPRADMGVLSLHCRFLEVVASLVARQVSWLQEEVARMHYTHVTESAESGIVTDKVIADSKSMRHVLHQIQQAGPSRATVFLRGESGVGKELMAQALHEASQRSDKSFVKLNCAAIPSELVEGELFGWRKGAFTGAVTSHRGLFQQADHGTLFLDEIGDLSLSAQAKLLRVIQDGVVQPIGSERAISVDVRIVCATNRPIEEWVKRGLFRKDLYYRINIFPVFIPPLRERTEDIIPLARHYLGQFASDYGRSVHRISRPALDLLVAYDWPGNIRELKNVIERAVLVCDEEALRAYHLPGELQSGSGQGVSIMREKGAGFTETVERLERDLITEALGNAQGNIHQAARDIGLTYRIIYYKMQKYGIDYKPFLHVATQDQE